jgi:hypothetical protein
MLWKQLIQANWEHEGQTISYDLINQSCIFRFSAESSFSDWHFVMAHIVSIPSLK